MMRSWLSRRKCSKSLSLRPLHLRGLLATLALRALLLREKRLDCLEMSIENMLVPRGSCGNKVRVPTSLLPEYVMDAHSHKPPIGTHQHSLSAGVIPL